MATSKGIRGVQGRFRAQTFNRAAKAARFPLELEDERDVYFGRCFGEVGG
jgi:hypothetical protein